jgi:ketosteroid isomerase-like protein
VVTNHESLVMAGDLDGVMSNFAPDIVVLAPGSPFMEGLGAMREFYESMLASGSFESTIHDYSGAELVGDVVVLHGVAESTLVPPEGPPIRMVNNFLHVLKSDETGAMKFWRVAFAPPSM